MTSSNIEKPEGRKLICLIVMVLGTLTFPAPDVVCLIGAAPAGMLTIFFTSIFGTSADIATMRFMAARFLQVYSPRTRMG